MARKHLGHRFKYYLNNNIPFNVPIHAVVHIFCRFPVLCEEIYSVFANMAQFWQMHMLYSKQIDKTKYLP